VIHRKSREARLLSVPSRRAWKMEERWYGSLLYPLRALPTILALAVLLTALTGALVLVLPNVVKLQGEPMAVQLVCAIYLLFPFLVLGYACNWLTTVMNSAAAGLAHPVRWLDRSPLPALVSCLTWLFCFLAGPFVPASISVLYWLYSGDLKLADWFILVELNTLALGYWLFAVLAVNRHRRILDANPARVTELIQQLGYRSLVLSVIASVLALANVSLALVVVEEFHRNAAAGLLLLVGCWASVLSSGAFLFRLLGVWSYRHRLQASGNAITEEADQGAE
jgi:hypothetical protein